MCSTLPAPAKSSLLIGVGASRMLGRCSAFDPAKGASSGPICCGDILFLRLSPPRELSAVCSQVAKSLQPRQRALYVSMEPRH